MKVLLCVGAAVGVGIASGQQNPPQWPDTVQVFDPSQSAGDIQEKVNAAFEQNGGHDPANHGQFSDKRFAFLFKPGSYTTDVPVGFYTQVLGLGTAPGDVVFTSERGVYCEEGDYYYAGGALDTFWRSAENFRTQATWDNTAGPGMLWAVSQAAHLRRVQVDHALTVYEYQPPYQGAGYSSGGFFANVEVGLVSSREHSNSSMPTPLLRSGATSTDGPPAVNLGSQQQWFARNSHVSQWNGGVWNVVVTGVDGAPASHCSNQDNNIPITNVPTTPLVAEKPYITIDDGGKYSLVVPAPKTDSHGSDFNDTAAKVIGFEQVYVTQPTDTAETINAKLSAGLHVVLSPAIYDLDHPLQVTHDDQVLLGLGMATLRPTNATEAVVVGNVDGARVAGIIAQAGPASGTSASPALIRFGDGSHAGTVFNPSFMHDVFCRVGGPDGTEGDPVAADVMVEVNSGFVIGDNMWFWRADHTVEGESDKRFNPVNHGLLVRGNDVTMYGLAVEHTLQDLVQWSGERGCVPSLIYLGMCCDRTLVKCFVFVCFAGRLQTNLLLPVRAAIHGRSHVWGPGICRVPRQRHRD